MKKRFLSLLCVLALCLGLLPVTALAAETAPETLYVGGTQIYQSGYWTSSDGGTTWDLQSNGQPADNYIHYDSDSATLTLKNATIKGGSNSEASKGAGIYALCSNGQSVSLTIVLIGENTIEGDYGILVEAQQGGIEGIDASLIIKSESGSGSSSLKVTGSGNYGISVKSGTGDASLTIENTTVNASTSGGYVAGVYVQSGVGATSSPRISLAVNGGSLTASGGSGNSKGIWFYVGSPNATGAATSLTVSGNAIVDAKAGGISASDLDGDISDQIVVDSDTGNSGGIVFDGTEGTVYGDVTLDKSLTINQGETLNIPEGSSLDCNGKLTNNGTILVSGGNLTGNLSGGTTLTTPNITEQPQDTTLVSGQSCDFSVTASVGESQETASLTYQWQQSTDNGSTWNNITDATSETYNIQSANINMNGYQYRCVVTAGGVSVISNPATLTVCEVTSLPYITTTSLPDGKVGTAYSQTLSADGDKPITWNITNGSLPAGLTLNENGVISGTPTTAGTFKFTVTATNIYDSDSKELSLTIQSATVPVTDVSLDKTTLELCTGNTATLIATVTPDDATNKAVTWESSNAEVATVEGGKVTAVGAGEANITVTTEDGSHTATCKVKVTQPTYSISADTTALDFDSVCPGYTQPAAQTVTITNTGNQPLTLNQPASTSSFEVGTLSKTVLAAGETATITVQPKAGLAEGTYSEDITVSSSQSATVTISASFAVKRNDNQDTSNDEPASTPTPVPAPTIVSGAEAVWRKGSGVGLTFTSDADFAGFQGVMVDGTAISAEHYTAKSGSTIVTLKAEYLETLSVGTHTVAILSDTGTAGARFTVASGTNVPQTGDESHLGLLLGLLAASTLTLVGATICKRRNRQ